MIGEPGLARIFEEHLEETRAHQAKLEARLEAHDGQPQRAAGRAAAARRARTSARSSARSRTRPRSSPASRSPSSTSRSAARSSSSASPSAPATTRRCGSSRASWSTSALRRSASAGRFEAAVDAALERRGRRRNLHNDGVAESSPVERELAKRFEDDGRGQAALAPRAPDEAQRRVVPRGRRRCRATCSGCARSRTGSRCTRAGCGRSTSGCGRSAARTASGSRGAGARVAHRWRFDDLNDLIREHNEWYPIESGLPLDPRTRDYVRMRGRSYRRLGARSGVGAR